MTQAYSAVQRITRFLERELREDAFSAVDASSDGDDDGPKEGSALCDSINTPLTLANACFCTKLAPPSTENDMEDKIASFQVSKFNLSVKKGEVLAVCGPVGSGKSSLINGIIDEMSSTTETVVTTKGKISFIAQNAFILNISLRENILFGLPFDPEFYEKVVDACCLRTDIELLGPAKDLTEIGERGVTLSGGK
jgi:ABC-type multidrug transport system fused ATPase/permease subunit